MKCPYCDGPVELVGGEAIYPHRPDLFALKFWLCEPCGAYVGTHKNSPKHAPLGRLANAELRRFKSKCHAAFDPIWSGGDMSRSEAYRRLAKVIGIPTRECHIGMFDEGRCLATLNAIRSGRLSAPTTAPRDGEKGGAT